VHVGILSSTGKTPLVKLENFLDSACVELLATLEAFNPGGTSTDRPARVMIESGRRSGAARGATPT
jgi:cysteine synthase